MDVVARRHGDLGEELRPVFARYDVLDEILVRRSYVKEPEHRFFMALLLNVEGRERIFGLIKQRFPDADPVEKVLDWIFDLSQTRVVMGMETANALGIPDFAQTEMFALEHMLLGKSDDEVKRAFAAESNDASTERIENAIAVIRSSAIFRALLTADGG
jgi:hypothetical protein